MADPIVYIVDDDEAMRNSLVWLLEPLGYKVLPFPSAREFLAAFNDRDTACLVTDVRMPGMSGLELNDELRRRGATLPVIIMTGHGDVPMAVRAMRAGALDFIEKPLDNQLLVDRINEALRVSAERQVEMEQRRGLRERIAALTPREREVAQAVASGKQNKAIAFDYGVGQKTVEIHRHNAMVKLGAGTAADLARLLTLAGELGENP